MSPALIARNWWLLCVLGMLAGVWGCNPAQPPVKPAAIKILPSGGSSTESVARAPFRLAPLPSEKLDKAVPRAARPDDWFADMTERSGIKFAYQNGFEARCYTLLETVGGGVALIDFDRDGDLDVFFNGGGKLAGPPVVVSGRPGALYRNDGDWKFTDVTTAMGLGASDLYTHGCIAGDYNRDGWPDLVVTGYGGCRLYHNVGGTRFEDVTRLAGLTDVDWFTAAAFGDYDRDGWLDLFVVAYADWKPGANPTCLYDELQGKRRDVCPPQAYAGRQHRLWRNRGNGKFDDVSEAAGLRSEMRGLGVVCVDFDADGWPDWFVANDVQENQLYFGGPHLPLEEQGALAGVAYSLTGEREGSMGTDVGDFNGDGIADLFYTNFTQQDNSLLQGDGVRGFMNVTEKVGLAGPSRVWVGFGCGLTDFNRDGWPELFVINGNVFYDSPESAYRQPSQLFRNLAGDRFVEASSQGGPYFSVPHPGRGAAVGDLDNDGSPDLVIVHQNEPVVLLRNQQSSPHWVRVQLRGTTSNVEGYGARVTLQAGDKRWTQWLASGRGYLSQSDTRLLFALPADTSVSVTVDWPLGTSETFSPLTLRTTHELVEGTGQRAAPGPRQQ